MVGDHGLIRLPTLASSQTAPDAEDLHRRIVLALSILQHRRWPAEDERHVSETIEALDGQSIDDIARGR